jgi:hypothetical protein
LPAAWEIANALLNLTTVTTLTNQNKMKITINLSESEVKGIKQYLKEVCDNDKPTKEDIKLFIDGVVHTINSPKESVSHYIKQFTQH